MVIQFNYMPTYSIRQQKYVKYTGLYQHVLDFLIHPTRKYKIPDERPYQPLKKQLLRRCIIQALRHGATQSRVDLDTYPIYLDTMSHRSHHPERRDTEQYLHWHKSWQAMGLNC